jgi:hypothetical protein
MKPELNEYDEKDPVQRRLIEDVKSRFTDKFFPMMKIFVHNITREYIFLSFDDAPCVVWIEYMHVYRSFDTFMALVEQFLKENRIQSIRRLFTSESCHSKSLIIRDTNILIQSGYKVFDMSLSKGDSVLCFNKTLSTRFTASTTQLSSIKETE